MRYAVYKSLDKKNSLFGIRGSYQKYALYGLGVSIFIGLIVGTSINSMIGTILAILLGAATYAGVLAVQSKYSEKERTKWFCSKKLPGYILMQPKRLSRYVKFRISERYEVRGKSKGSSSDGIYLDEILERMEREKEKLQEQDIAVIYDNPTAENKKIETS